MVYSAHLNLKGAHSLDRSWLDSGQILVRVVFFEHIVVLPPWCRDLRCISYGLWETVVSRSVVQLISERQSANFTRLKKLIISVWHSGFNRIHSQSFKVFLSDTYQMKCQPILRQKWGAERSCGNTSKNNYANLLPKFDLWFKQTGTSQRAQAVTHSAQPMERK